MSIAAKAMDCVACPDGKDQCAYVASASCAGGRGRSMIRLEML